MKRPLWLSHSASSEDICNTVASLLSVYADGMASPADAQKIETHLPQCEGCRSALSWMQVTHATLASRPVAVPPPDLHLRIALAIAASSPAPVTLRPSRVFTLRTLYAAAASVTALGVALSYPLWHTPAGVSVTHPAKPAVLATAAKMPLTVHPRFAPKVPARPLVASISAKSAVKHGILARKIVSAPAALPEHIAANPVPAERSVLLPSVTLKAPVHHAPVTQKIASRSIVPAETHGIEKHSPLPAAKIMTPKQTEGPKVANVIKEPSRVPLDIQTPRVTPDPVRQFASVHQSPSSEYEDPLGGLKAQLREKNARIRDVSFAAISVPAQRSYHDVTHAMQEVGNTDQTAFIDAVHGNQ